ncbi:MAG: YgcG family protein [Gammaproteobacteria bacterium]|nr:YgcG family protein [Gammaproteobacteria bacterium]
MIQHPALRLAALASALLLAALPGSAALAQALQPIPALAARVTDLTGTLTTTQQAQLESRLAEFESKKGAQIAVLIVPSTQPEEIEQYSIRIVDAWQLGRAKPDDGALLLVAKDDRAMRIEVGRGLEGALTDLVSKRIISDTITPLFRQGDFAGGIAAGVEQMIRVVDGEPLPEPDQHWGGGTERLADMLPFLLGIIFVGSAVLRSLFGRALGSVATGGVTGGIAWWLTSILWLAAGVGIVALIISLLLGFGGGGRWSSRPGHGGWTSGGWGRGGFGTGGMGRGGGGFGGGGGSFGGGGASGRW